MRVSFIIPTLNSAQTLGDCLAAIRAQTFTDYEIVVADGGSTDDTVRVARRFGVETVCPNPLKTGEAGKAAGINAARGELVALVDSDNILPDPQWLARMLAPFEDPAVFATEPLRYSARPGDPSLTRYFAALGMNDPVCLFAGNYDRVSAVTGKWTGLKIPLEARTEPDGTRWFVLHPRNTLPTIGANGFIFRRSILAKVTWEPYFFDIDVAAEAVAKGCGAVAKVDTSIIHLYCARFGDFVRKQNRRIRDFLYFAAAKQRTYPWRDTKARGVVLFVLSAATVLPLVVQTALLAARSPKGSRLAALWHLPVCYATLCVYGFGVLGKLIGLKPRLADRQNWQARAN